MVEKQKWVKLLCETKHWHQIGPTASHREHNPHSALLESMLGSLQNTLDGPTKNSLLLNPDYAVHSSNVLFEEIESVYKSTSAGVGVETWTICFFYRTFFVNKNKTDRL